MFRYVSILFEGDVKRLDYKVYLISNDKISAYIFHSKNPHKMINDLKKIREDVEKGIIRKINVVIIIPNHKELTIASFIIGLIGINKNNMKDYLSRDSLKIFSSDEFQSLLEIGYAFGKYNMFIIPESIKFVKVKKEETIDYMVSIDGSFYYVVTRGNNYIIFKHEENYKNFHMVLDNRKRKTPFHAKWDEKLVVSDMSGTEIFIVEHKNKTLSITDKTGEFFENTTYKVTHKDLKIEVIEKEEPKKYIVKVIFPVVGEGINVSLPAFEVLLMNGKTVEVKISEKLLSILNSLDMNDFFFESDRVYVKIARDGKVFISSRSGGSFENVVISFGKLNL